MLDGLLLCSFDDRNFGLSWDIGLAPFALLDLISCLGAFKDTPLKINHLHQYLVNGNKLVKPIPTFTDRCPPPSTDGSV